MVTEAVESGARLRGWVIPGVDSFARTVDLLRQSKLHKPASCVRPGIRNRKEKREIDWNSERPRAQSASVCTHVSHVSARARVIGHPLLPGISAPRHRRGRPAAPRHAPPPMWKLGWLRPRPAGSPEASVSARSCSRLPRASASLGQAAAWAALAAAIRALFSTWCPTARSVAEPRSTWAGLCCCCC